MADREQISGEGFPGLFRFVIYITTAHNYAFNTRPLLVAVEICPVADAKGVT